MEELPPYLPEWATLSEATRWLEALTGEAWPLPRLLAHGVLPSLWLTPDAADPVAPVVLERVFEGRHEGFLAPICFAGDTHRLAVDRTMFLTMTRTPSGELVRFTPGIPADLDELRWPAASLRKLAAPNGAAPTPKGPTIKRAELIERNERQWPTIGADLREASRRHPGLAAAMAGGGRWREAVALAWARGNDRIRDPGDGATLQAALTGRQHRIK